MASRRVAGTKRVVRSGSTGRYVSKATAARHPRITVVESTSGKGGSAGSRSAITGRYVTAARHPNTVATEGEKPFKIAISPLKPQPSEVTRKTKRSEAPRAGSAKSRSMPADDPLASERTRWLADVVGGGGRLAAMLGVSASQTSRWSSGQERPGVAVAPLLIDLEHVLARVRLVWADPAASVWMNSANAYLDGARPINVLQLSGPGPVLQALDAQAWGGAA